MHCYATFACCLFRSTTIITSILNKPQLQPLDFSADRLNPNSSLHIETEDSICLIQPDHNDTKPAQVYTIFNNGILTANQHISTCVYILTVKYRNFRTHSLHFIGHLYRYHLQVVKSYMTANHIAVFYIHGKMLHFAITALMTCSASSPVCWQRPNAKQFSELYLAL